MPAPTYPIPTTSSPILLYRHLLRECSYLPPAFRAIVTTAIQTRFHKHREHDPRIKAHIARAKNALRTLRAANSGDKDAMEGLVAKGFGRSGIRRRELMAKFVIPQGPSNSQSLETLLSPAEEDGQTMSQDQPDSDAHPDPHAPMSKRVFYEKWDQTKLLRALQSQRNQQKEGKGSPGWRGSAIKSTNPDQLIPEKTIWDRPPSEVLKRAKRANWWKRSADKILPPLGKGEWRLLEQLSAGAQEEAEWAIPERRTMVTPLAGSHVDPESWNWERHAMKPTAAVERPKALTQQRRSGQKDSNPYGVGDRDRTLSARWFRRTYNRTWQLTPTMAQDPNTLLYSFTWGRSNAKLPRATKNQLEIFQGVDEKGHKLKAP